MRDLLGCQDLRFRNLSVARRSWTKKMCMHWCLAATRSAKVARTSCWTGVRFERVWLQVACMTDTFEGRAPFLGFQRQHFRYPVPGPAQNVGFVFENSNFEI